MQNRGSYFVEEKGGLVPHRPIVAPTKNLIYIHLTLPTLSSPNTFNRTPTKTLSTSNTIKPSCLTTQHATLPLFILSNRTYPHPANMSLTPPLTNPFTNHLSPLWSLSRLSLTLTPKPRPRPRPLPSPLSHTLRPFSHTTSRHLPKRNERTIMDSEILACLNELRDDMKYKNDPLWEGIKSKEGRCQRPVGRD
jgi:hypothetical protein